MCFFQNLYINWDFFETKKWKKLIFFEIIFEKKIKKVKKSEIFSVNLYIGFLKKWIFCDFLKYFWKKNKKKLKKILKKWKSGFLRAFWSLFGQFLGQKWAFLRPKNDQKCQKWSKMVKKWKKWDFLCEFIYRFFKKVDFLWFFELFLY